MPPRIVVTGAAGYVGANLVRELLNRNHSVRALIHHDRRGVAGLDVELAQGDLRDFDSLNSAFAGADLVYHTAAQVSISSRGWSKLETINVIGTHNVVEACLRARVGRLVYFSSVEALELRPVDLPVDESSTLVDGRARSPTPAPRPLPRELHWPGQSEVWRWWFSLPQLSWDPMTTGWGWRTRGC